jgi:MoxR-like ATPase
MTYILSPEKEADIMVLLSEKGNSTVKSMLIFGEPGAGKTSFAKYLADSIDAHFIFAPCYDGISSDQLLYNWDLGLLVDAMTDEQIKGREALKDGFLIQALKMSQTRKTVLLLDEIDKAKPSVDTFLLTYMQECMFNDPIQGVIKGNPENLIVIATSNKRRDLEDALDRRFTLIREFFFPAKSELMMQINTHGYNEDKVNFIIRGVLAYRDEQVERKPSQSQISDLFRELSILHESKLGKSSARNLKVRALKYKLSQIESDHIIVQKVFRNVAKNWQNLL